MKSIPRIAFFTDSYHDVNGVSRTSQHFVKFAKSRRIAFLSVRAGPKTALFNEESVSVLELKRSLISFALDDGLKFDPAMQRHIKIARAAIRKFRPDLIHITSPGDIGILGAWIAHTSGIPIVAAWQTNIHEYAGRRLDRLLPFFPHSWRKSCASEVERRALDLVIRFYKIARIILVPNNELKRMVQDRSSKPCFIMRRGIDTEKFSPSFRDRKDQVFRIGYVGRLRPEKNVRMLRDIEKTLLAEGARYFQFHIVGDGTDRRWLEQNMQYADFAGVLTGKPLSQAYANMDVFVFPSRTDTFGNVVLEAMASVLPAIVTDSGGPKSIVRPGETGFVASDIEGFCSAILSLMKSPLLHNQMSIKARCQACDASWDTIFNDVLKAYDTLWSGPSQDGYSYSQYPHASSGNAACMPSQMLEESRHSQIKWPDTY